MTPKCTDFLIKYTDLLKISTSKKQFVEYFERILEFSHCFRRMRIVLFQAQKCSCYRNKNFSILDKASTVKFVRLFQFSVKESNIYNLQYLQVTTLEGISCMFTFNLFGLSAMSTLTEQSNLNKDMRKRTISDCREQLPNVVVQ